MGGEGLSRRSLLRHGMIGAVGIMGATSLGRAATLEHPRVATMDPAATLRFDGEGFRLISPRGIGHRLSAGDVATGVGELVDARGARVGSFRSTVRFGGDDPRDPLRAVSLLERHTFVFEDGTIYGAGARASIFDDGRFAVTGGDGAYASLSGTYVAVQAFPELGGDGTASFDFLSGR